MATSLSHKRIDETMGYVHVAERSRREIPETILRAAENKSDPNHRVVAMLGARAKKPDKFFRRYQRTWNDVRILD